MLSRSVLLKPEFSSSEEVSDHGLKELYQVFSELSLCILKVKDRGLVPGIAKVSPSRRRAHGFLGLDRGGSGGQGGSSSQTV